jgi:hypothetical protein
LNYLNHIYRHQAFREESSPNRVSEQLPWAVIAYVDESYEAGPTGVYVLAAVLCERDDAEVRRVMLALREPWRLHTKLHFHDADAKRAAVYLDAVRGLGRPVVVVVARPCPKPERARRKALERLLWVLRARIDGVAVESRGRRQNRDDGVVFAAMQRHGRFSYAFPLGRDEPILWAADIVASSVYRACSRGERQMSDRLGAVELHELDVR